MMVAERIVVPMYNRKVTIIMKTPDLGKHCSAESVKKEVVELWYFRLTRTNIRVMRDMIAAGKYGMNNSSKTK